MQVMPVLNVHVALSIRDAGGITFARATLNDVLAQVSQDWAGGLAAQFRATPAYLVEIVEGRTVVLAVASFADPRNL
jgi:hypothetical protein